VPERDDLQRVHTAVLQRGPERVPHGPQQVALLVRGQAPGGPGRMDAGPPQDLVGQQVADPGDPVLVQQMGLDRGRSNGHGRPELGRGDPLRVRAERFDRRVEPHAAQPPGVDQHQPSPVLERQREAGPAVVAGPAAPLPVVAAVDLGPARAGDDDLARHPEVDPQRDRAGRAVPAGGHTGLAPHALAPPHRADQLTAEQRPLDLTGLVGTADKGVGVVDVHDAAPQPGPLDDRPGRLDLRKLRHCPRPPGSGPGSARSWPRPPAPARGGR
jgi:hypothetical protein